MDIIMGVLLVITVPATLYFMLKYFRTKKAIRSLISNLGKRGLRDEANLIKIPMPDNNMEMLAAEINRIFSDYNVALTENKAAMKQHNELIADISHDMRTPLTSIIGNLELLCGTSLATNQAEYAQTASRRAAQMQTLLSDFFELSLIDSGAIQPHLVKVNLTDIICDCMVDSYDAFVSKDITPIFDTADTPMYVNGDVHMLKRVIQNLLDNSVKYSTGDIVIAVQDDRVPCLTISNPVSPTEKLDVGRLFDRFYSQDKARTNGSVGLGLSIVDRFLALMGGSVAVSKSEDILIFTLMFQPSTNENEVG